MKKYIIFIIIFFNILNLSFSLSYEEKQKMIRNKYMEKIQVIYNLTEQQKKELLQDINKNIKNEEIRNQVLRDLVLNKKSNKMKKLNNMVNQESRIINEKRNRNKYREKIKREKSNMKKFIMEKIKNLRAKYQKNGPNFGEKGPPGDFDIPGNGLNN